MKPILAVLIALFLLLQYELWFSPGGIQSIWQLKRSIDKQRVVNHKVHADNTALVADIRDLKRGDEAVEERARSSLGLIHKGETFYQVVLPKGKSK